MTPDTLHLLASMVRHSRGMATSIEKWVQKQQPSPVCREVLQLVGIVRGVLTLVEQQIGQSDVSLDADRAEVEQPTRMVTSRLSSPHHLTQVK